MQEDKKKMSSGTQKMVCEKCGQDWNINVNIAGKCCHCQGKETIWVDDSPDNSIPKAAKASRIIAY